MAMLPRACSVQHVLVWGHAECTCRMHAKERSPTTPLHRRYGCPQVRVSNNHGAPAAEAPIADGSVAVTISGGDSKAAEGAAAQPTEDDGHETFSSRDYADEFAGEQAKYDRCNQCWFDWLEQTRCCAARRAPRHCDDARRGRRLPGQVCAGWVMYLFGRGYLKWLSMPSLHRVGVTVNQ